MPHRSVAARRCPSCGQEAAEGARFCASCGSQIDGTPAAAPAGDELRPVTVLFADLVGSTRLGARLTPEEVKVLVGECVGRMCGAVEEYGGRVQAYMGDGICAYFGVPRAREDDAERAARAALTILEQIASTRADASSAWGVDDLEVRIGINSGWAAVGLVGSAQPGTVALGDATNLAARLQAAAEPGSALVGEATAKRLSQRFVIEPAGRVHIRGIDEKVATFVLVGPRQREATPPVTPLVGREREVARLDEVLRDLDSGRGRILLLSGEPGIGKSRLLAELRERAGDTVTWLEGHCLSYRALPFVPFVEALRSWLGIAEGEVELAVRTKARARLGELLADDAEEELRALGRLLGLRGETSEREPRSTSTTGRSAELHHAYSTWLRSLAARRPVVVALEDVEWLDSSSRLLAESVLELTDREPLLVAATLRPHGPSHGTQLRLRALGDFSHRTVELPLGPLPARAATALLATLRPELDAQTQTALLDQAEGNPLYLEELARALADTGRLERQRAWTIASGPRRQLPASLESLLLARVDALPDSARVLVQAAAVTGRTFPFRALDRLAPTDAVEDDLATLLRSQIVRELSRYPEREYGFEHGLLQEVVLSTLPATTRKRLYARVAAVFEELFPDELERLAHYHAQSDQPERALEFLRAAATRAESLGALREAVQHLERAHRLAKAGGNATTDARICTEIERLHAAELEAESEDHERSRL